ncbi:hypothetical protein NQ318_015217 [Aromia moschata]|uniref:Uncharacterized protein n=1 Tax=Aromia moschata TaxID=1265417 RepID=A0AAV8XL24_9CUCU|nr:hypothetical protein NQ318_015217 [Aromia moschata]
MSIFLIAGLAVEVNLFGHRECKPKPSGLLCVVKLERFSLSELRQRIQEAANPSKNNKSRGDGLDLLELLSRRALAILLRKISLLVGFKTVVTIERGTLMDMWCMF